MPNSKRPRDRREPWWTLARRRWVYGVAVAAVPLAGAYGLISENLIVPLLTFAAALLGVSGLALKHPTQD